jgi:hypothetical protein
MGYMTCSQLEYICTVVVAYDVTLLSGGSFIVKMIQFVEYQITCITTRSFLYIQYNLNI